MKHRDKVGNFIKQSALTQKIVYPQPGAIVALLAKQGTRTNKPYVIRRYTEMGIILENGLWVKEITS